MDKVLSIGIDKLKEAIVTMHDSRGESFESKLANLFGTVK